jgi:hypothetical protein
VAAQRGVDRKERVQDERAKVPESVASAWGEPLRQSVMDADYQLRVGTPTNAHQLMTRFWDNSDGARSIAAKRRIDLSC